MINHKPVAGDFTFVEPFLASGYTDDRFNERNILFATAAHDVDGDTVHLAFVNGQRIAHASDPQPWTTIEGEYGALTVSDTGEFSYAWDTSNPAVQAMQATGGQLTDHFTFKVSDGHGGTDFGYFNVATGAPTPGTSTVTFEDASQPYFPDVYKGLAWGLVDDGQPLNLNINGNHFLYTTPNDPLQWTEITTSNLQQDVTLTGVDIKTSSLGDAQFGADITFDGYSSDGTKHSMTVSIGPGDGNFNMGGAEHVSLASLGPIDELDIYYGFPGEDPNSHANSVLLFDNFSITA
ncbi:MAG: VCBS domain-containing protein [Devosia sp.]|nr:VCBS domain-containing protein [Devosia sp.]